MKWFIAIAALFVLIKQPQYLTEIIHAILKALNGTNG